MSGAKRKSVAAAESGRPAKKAQLGNIKVTHLRGPDSAKPVIATTPGFVLPPDINFTPYVKQEPDGKSTLLLHSSDHPTIDYLATETKVEDLAEKHMKHYIGVFNPKTNELKVMEAKTMTIRKSVRTIDQDGEEDEEERPQATSSSRAALTHAFGTKKSRKAVASIAENRLLAREGESENPVSSAILNSIQEDDEDSDNVSTDVRVNKPFPRAELQTTDLTEVYDLKDLVRPANWGTTLSQMPIARWKDSIQKDKAVSTSMRYVATRVTYLTKKHLKDPLNVEALQKVQLLRYIQLLVEIRKYVARQSSRKRMESVEKWPKGTTSDTALSLQFKTSLVATFFPDLIPTEFRKTLLTSTILALTLHIPPPIITPGETKTMLFTETSEIALDLAVPASEINKLYRELGCKLETMTDSELKKCGWDKAARKIDEETGKVIKGPSVKFAKLRFPIEFPKVSSGRPGGRR